MDVESRKTNNSWGGGGRREGDKVLGSDGRGVGEVGRSPGEGVGVGEEQDHGCGEVGAQPTA